VTDEIKRERVRITSVDRPRGTLPNITDKALVDEVITYLRYERERCLFLISRERGLVRALPLSKEVSDKMDDHFRWLLGLVRCQFDGILPEWEGDEELFADGGPVNREAN
jgi:hypothetical protein